MAQPLVGILFLTLFYLATDALVRFASVPLPSAIVAMVVLGLFLALYRRVPKFIAQGADALIRLFPLLFVPPMVAVAGEAALLKSHAFVLIFAVTGSTLIGLLVTAFLYRWLAPKGGGA